jgi:multicomponent Na+:H+ antiporter subunit B
MSTKKTDILDVMSRKLAPFILLFGFYLIAYGHLSPGGGFQGGVVLASGVILLVLCKDVDSIQNLFPLHTISLLESLGFLAFLIVGILGIVFMGDFLTNFLPTAEAGSSPGANFIFLLNMIIGLKVGAGITLMCFYLFWEEI